MTLRASSQKHVDEECVRLCVGLERENIERMREIQKLRLRRAVGFVGGILLVLTGIYLRCFVFLKISPGALLVYGAFIGGGLLLEDARKSNRSLKAQSVSD
jgi:hypothetical protein